MPSAMPANGGLDFLFNAIHMFSRIARHHGPCWDILGHDTTRADNGILTNFDPWKNDCVGANPASPAQIYMAELA
ncbi:MAG: hypothetical protein AUJ20_11835 [Comamonadaceae bacterium CG1_02_60_18]|nr:MAG: hypothetical protein AUJ20_11835 [Comamonadaceae bacterium CG1_02_60_18]